MQPKFLRNLLGILGVFLIGTVAEYIIYFLLGSCEKEP